MRTFLAALTLALAAVLGVAGPASAAADTSTTPGQIHVADTTFYLTVTGERRNGAMWVTGARVGYSDPGNGAMFCSRIRSININVGAIGGYNPGSKRVRCDDDGASTYIDIPDRRLGRDRCTGASVFVDVKYAGDNRHQIPQACL